MSTRDQNYQNEKDITNAVLKGLENSWGATLLSLLPELSEAVDAGFMSHVTCPYHRGKGDFRITKNFDATGEIVCTCTNGTLSKFDVIMFARNIPFIEAKRMLIESKRGLDGSLHNTSRFEVAQKPRKEHNHEADDAELKKRISRHWNDSVQLDHKDARPVRNWLRTRGLGQTIIPIRALRCHPSMGYWHDGKKLGEYPAIVAMARRPDGKTSTIHRTFLMPDGKSKVQVVDAEGNELDARKQYPAPSTHPITESAIRLSDSFGPVLSVGEGLETMLSAQLIAGYPSWSCLNRVLLEQVVIPDATQLIIVWADNDRSMTGQISAANLVARLREEGRRAVAFLPPYPMPAEAKGFDWNDAVMQQGLPAVQNNIEVLKLKRRIAQILKKIDTQPTHKMEMNHGRA